VRLRLVWMVTWVAAAGCKSPLRYCDSDADCVDQVCAVKYHRCTPKADGLQPDGGDAVEPDGGAGPLDGGCTPVCSGASCGASDGCGGTCAAGSGCTVGPRVQGQLGFGAGTASSPAGHSVARGHLVGTEAGPAAPGGHAISQGLLSH
jgi:hypothetical protein